MKKVDYPLDKHQWSPSLIPGPIVLISTYNAARKPNIAPKSWLQMVSFEPPILMFSGVENNTTEKNIIASGCFGVNIADVALAAKIYKCIQWFGQERIDKSGFTLSEATKIQAPLVNECKAHLECRLHSTKIIGQAFVVFGEIVAASIWEDILNAEPEKKYELLNQIVFLEDKMFAEINNVSTVDKEMT